MNHPELVAIVIAVCLVLSFLFSGMEAGVLALSRLRIRQMFRSGNSSARVLMGFLESPENFLWTILVGNTLANFAAVSLLVTLLRQWLLHRPGLLLAAFLLMVFFFYAFLELLPKMLFRALPNRLCLFMARPFRVIHLALSPLVALVKRLSDQLLRFSGGKAFTGLLFGSREEMRLVMQESAQSFTSEERQMINRVLDLQNVRVRDISIPMEKVSAVTAKSPVGEAMRIAQEKKLSWLPVWRGKPFESRIAGVVSIRSIIYQRELQPDKPAGDFLKPALFMEEDLRLETALKRMQRSGQRLAIVLDGDQRETGIVSLEDILKFIFGQVNL
jgi:CBS domain containing-hemolysin-like protein